MEEYTQRLQNINELLLKKKVLRKQVALLNQELWQAEMKLFLLFSKDSLLREKIIENKKDVRFIRSIGKKIEKKLSAKGEEKDKGKEKG